MIAGHIYCLFADCNIIMYMQQAYSGIYIYMDFSDIRLQLSSNDTLDDKVSVLQRQSQCTASTVQRIVGRKGKSTA